MTKKNWILLGIGTAIAATATWLIVRGTGKGKNEKPPRKAPQLSIQNPGDQSEFITSATESEMG